LGIEVLFVLPRSVSSPGEGRVQVLSATGAAPGRTGVFRHTRFRAVPAAIQPYLRPEDLAASERAMGVPGGRLAPGAPGARRGVRLVSAPPEWEGGPVGDAAGVYTGDLFSQVDRYAALSCAIAQEEDFDVIHAHDWMTFPAGIAVRDLTGKPLVVHVHSTEFDRSGLNVNQRIYDIERAGMHAASKVIAVSHLTRNVILKHYGVDPRKVEVVYNAIDDEEDQGGKPPLPPIRRDEKIVLFLGRVTMQKGPEYFLAAAKRVLEVMENVRFVMAGSGDMIRRMIELAAQMGIGHKVLFTGFLRGNDVRRVFRMADLYVMPSVSEPFGLTPLEALSHDVPVLISKQSGVAEVLTHALKVDFWDVDEMANKIIAVLRHPPLHATLRDHGSIEVKRFSWSDTASNCIKVYQAAMGVPAA